MKPVLWILAVLFEVTFGLPQIPSVQENVSIGDASPSLVSPWSQWMSLKAPPISLAMPKKKKLLPGPPPPEGVTESPWVSWTRMKVSSALAPPPPPPPPSPVLSLLASNNSSDASSPEQAIWIQWTQMKLPMTNPLSPASAPQEMPLNAWNSAQAPEGLGLTKRMAPDRFVASTIAPRFSGWPAQSPQQEGDQDSQNWPLTFPQQLTNVSPAAIQQFAGFSPVFPSLPQASERVGVSQSTPPQVSLSQMSPAQISSLLASLPAPAAQQLLATASPALLDKVGITLEENPDVKILSALPQLPPQVIAQLAKEGELPQQWLPVPAPLHPSLVHVPLVKPKPVVSPVGTTPNPEVLASALKFIPPPVLTEIMAKATPQEVAELAVKIEAVGKSPIKVKPLVELLPFSIVPKLSPQLLPLLVQPVNVAPQVEKSPVEKIKTAIALSSIPEPVRDQILAVATPPEEAQLVETLSKLEALPPPEKELVKNLQVEDILPATLIAKLPPQVGPLLAAKLAAPVSLPVLKSAIPTPLLSLLIAQATPEELTEVVENLAILEKVSPIPAPPILAILPPSLVAKLPPMIIPVLQKEPVVIPAVATTPVPPPPKSSPLSIIPEQILEQVLLEATPQELAELSAKIEKLEDMLPPPPTVAVGILLPPTLISKLSPEVIPLLRQEVTIPPTPQAALVLANPALSVIPEPVLDQVLKVATPEELKVLAAQVEKVEGKVPIKVPLSVVIPSSVISKLSPSIAPLLIGQITIPPKPVVVAAKVEPVAGVIPPPVLQAVVAVASPEEINELIETVTKLEALSKEEKVTAGKLEVVSILPPSLVPKLPKELAPLLAKPVVIPEQAPTPVPAILRVIPEPVLGAVVAAASPEELKEIEDTLKKVEAVPAELKPMLQPLQLTTILPPSLVAKLPAQVKPLLAKPIKVVPGKAVLPPVAQVPEMVKVIPKPVLEEILAKATPIELAQVAETIEKLEALPVEQKPVISKLQVETLLPPTLVSKLSPKLAPLLAAEIVLPITPEQAILPAVPATSLVQGVAPPVPQVPSPLTVIPQPILEAILSVATPAEIATLESTISQIEEASKMRGITLTVQVENLLPLSLVPKIPAETRPLLDSEIDVVAPPPEVITEVEPILSKIPAPILGAIIEAASPAEIAQLEENLKELEAIPAEERVKLPEITLGDVLPPTLPPKLSPQLAPLLALPIITPAPAQPSPVPEPAALPTPPATESTEAPWLSYINSVYGIPETPATEAPPPPVLASSIEAPPTPAEEKLLIKWAKVILQKTGNPVKAPTVPGEIPPLQAAWMEWIQLRVNETQKAKAITPAPVLATEDATTEYPWTQWLKLKSNATLPVIAPPLDVTTATPEKAILEWLEQLEKTTEAPLAPTISPETEAKVVEILKQLGIENVPLSPEQLQEILAAVESSSPPPETLPAAIPPPGTLPSSPFIPSMMGYWPPPMSPFMYMNPYLTPSVSAPLPPPETVATSPVSIPELANLLEKQAEVAAEGNATTSRTITANELAALTPTKFAALLKDILKDCNKTNVLVTRSHGSSSYGGKGGYRGGAYPKYKNKFSGTGKFRRALLPIPSLGVAFPPQASPDDSPSSLLPLPKMTMPKVETAGTVLDPAYWTAQKSFFLSKLFSTLAKVALNDTQPPPTTTPNPKEQLEKQISTVLLGDMTRSVKQQQKEENADEYEEEEEEGQDVDENELVTNDKSEPNLPKEPENPLHKLFKFGVQKTVLSDISTTTTPSPIYIYITPPTPEQTTPSLQEQKEMVDRLKGIYEKNKKDKKKKKQKPKSQKAKQSSKHHHRARKPTTKTTTESPVDFELLAKALLQDNKGAKK